MSGPSVNYWNQNVFLNWSMRSYAIEIAANQTKQNPPANPSNPPQNGSLESRTTILGKGQAPMQIDELAEQIDELADTVRAAARRAMRKGREPRIFTFSDYHEFLSNSNRLKSNSPNVAPTIQALALGNRARSW